MQTLIGLLLDIGHIATYVLIVGVAIFLTSLFRRDRKWMLAGQQVMQGSAVLLFGCAAVVGFLEGDYSDAAICLVFMAACAYVWWDNHPRNRGKRRAARWLGNKARAARAKLVRGLRSLKPRPGRALRPHPSPA